MESGYGVSSVLPPACSTAYEFFLFHHPDHLLLQAREWSTFYLIKKSGNKALAQVSFHIEGQTARSPARAPFGSYLYDANIPTQLLFDFIRSVESELQKTGVREIRMVEPPLYYRKSGDILQAILFNLGYAASNAEISAGILVDKNNFEAKIDSWEKRKLRQAAKKGVACHTLPFAELETVYEFILACRKERGHELSMSFEQLHETANKFRKSFVLHGAMLRKELVAASIAIHVSPSILYNFYSGHLRKFDDLSPVVTVVEGLYRYCKTRRMRLLDLGTSSQGGQPNFSLLEFKLRLGAVPSMKLTFEKKLR